jgi:hypothetical protein
LTLDDPNDRVGINQTTPTEALDVVGNILATGSVTGSTLGGTLSTAAQPNITSVGTLSSLTVTGNVTIDTNTLKVDSTNNRVGVNTTSPTEALDVTGNVKASGSVTGATLAGTISTAAQPNITSVGTLSSLTVTGNVTIDTNTLKVDSTNNRVGVNTTSPTEALDVTGNVKASGTVTIANATVSAGTGSPEAVIAAPVGSMYMRKDGASGTTLYTKTSGTGNTGWETVGGTPIIGSIITAKRTTSLSVSAGATVNLLSFNLPYAGLYNIATINRFTSGNSFPQYGAISTANNTTTASYPDTIELRPGGVGANAPSFQSILYRATTAGTKYWNFRNSSSITWVVAADGNEIVITYMGV